MSELTMEEVKAVIAALDRLKYRAKYACDGDGYTAWLESIDLVEWGKTKSEALDCLAESIYEYAIEYMQEWGSYYSAPNRKHHWPYVIKTLLLDDKRLIRKEIVTELDNGEQP